MRRLIPYLFALLPALLLGCDECAQDYDCPGDRVCQAGACSRAVCTSDRACPPGRRCAENACVEVKPVLPPFADAFVFQVLDAGR